MLMASGDNYTISAAIPEALKNTEELTAANGKNYSSTAEIFCNWVTSHSAGENIEVNVEKNLEVGEEENLTQEKIMGNKPSVNRQL